MSEVAEVISSCWSRSLFVLVVRKLAGGDVSGSLGIINSSGGVFERTSEELDADRRGVCRPRRLCSTSGALEMAVPGLGNRRAMTQLRNSWPREASKVEAVRSCVIASGEAVGVDGLESKAGEAAEGDALVLNVVAVLGKVDLEGEC